MKKCLLNLFSFLLLSTLANAQWTKVNIPHDNFSYPTCVEVPNENTIWASVRAIDNTGALTTKKYIRSKDNCATWTRKTISGASTDWDISNLFPIDADTCYAAMFDNSDGFGGGIFKTTNGGTSWNQVGVGQIFDENSFPDFVYFWDAQHGMALGDRNFVAGTEEISLEVYTTEDYGNTWTRVPSTNLPATTDLPIGIVNAYSVVGHTVWAQIFDGDPTAGAPQYVYKSTDQGHTWERYPVDNSLGNFSDITFLDEQNGVINGVASDLTSFLYKTTDGGETWQNVSYIGPLFGFYLANVPGTNALVSTSYANPDIITDGVPNGSSYSWDLGNTWTLIDTGSANTHSDVKFLNSNIGWSGQYRQTSFASGGMFRWTGTILPVTLSSFAVTKSNKSVLLNWATASESNFNYFGIERSTNGSDFKEIGRVTGAGNSSLTKQYSFPDAGYSNGKNYYRLKLVNKDGSFNYSQTQWVDMSLIASLKIYPNPVKNVLTIEGLDANKTSMVSIINNNGNTIQRVIVKEALHNFNVSSLSAGNYYVRIDSDGQITTLKFVKE